jgi:hypothetical protein
VKNVNKDLRSGKLALGPLLVAAIVAVILVAGAATQDRRAQATTDQPAQAATKKPTPTPKPKPTPKPTPTPAVNLTTSVTGSVLCRGTIANTQDSADLPNADIYMEFALFKGSPGTLPTAKKPVAITGLSLMAINAACTSLNGALTGFGPPCAQEGEFYGSITLGAGGGPNPMTLTFVPLPAASDDDDVLQGCQASFQVLPYSKSTQAFFVSTGALSQDLAPGAVSCVPIGTSIVVSCQEINS